MSKHDVVKEHKELYGPPSSQAVFVEVPECRYLMIDGRGDPNNSAEYEAAVGALYAASYTIKFSIPPARHYKVMPLEGLWWADDMEFFTAGNKDAWSWTMMIAQPDVLSDDELRDGIAAARRKKDLPALEALRIESLTEGPCAQIMHVGPYSDEVPTIEKRHAFIAEHGYRPAGKHHEIYLADPCRTKPERLKTVLRQPVA